MTQLLDDLDNLLDSGPTLPKGHLSPSQINTYIRCPKQYEYSYVRGIKSPPGVALVQGISVHRGQEVNLSQKIETGEDLPVDDIKDAAGDKFDERAPETDFEGENPGEIKDYTLKLVETQHEGISKIIQPKAVETSFKTLVRGIEFWGRIDVVDNEDVTRDLKTSNRRPAKNDLDGNLQAMAYALVRRKEGFEPRVKFDYVVKNKTPVTDLREAVYPEHQLKAVEMTIEGVARGIDAGIFPPHTEGWHCSPKYCGYWDMCPAGGGEEVDVVDMAATGEVASA